MTNTHLPFTLPLLSLNYHQNSCCCRGCRDRIRAQWWRCTAIYHECWWSCTHCWNKRSIQTSMQNIFKSPSRRKEKWTKQTTGNHFKSHQKCRRSTDGYRIGSEIVIRRLWNSSFWYHVLTRTRTPTIFDMCPWNICMALIIFDWVKISTFHSLRSGSTLADWLSLISSCVHYRLLLSCERSCLAYVMSNVINLFSVSNN